MELAASSNNRRNTPFASSTFETAETESENVDINFNLMQTSNFKWPPQRGALLSSLAIVAVAVALNCAILLIFWLGAVRQSQQSTVDKTEKQLPCGSWTVAYSDAKCLKVFEQTMATYDEAARLCAEANPTASLLKIQTAAEQAFVEKLFFGELRLFNPIWIDGHWDNFTDQFVTADDHRPLLFKNWAEGSPNRQEMRSCIQMLAEHHTEEGNRGRWVNVRCQAKGVIVCQRLQSWPWEKFQEGLLRTEIEADLHRQKLKSVELALEEATTRHHKELEVAKNGLIPVGFIYVQLPKEAPPSEVWPSFTWKEISSSYSNVFFRVVGDRAAAFGSTQEASSPRLIGVKATDDASNKSTSIQLKAGKWSEGLYVRTSPLEQNSKTQSGQNDLKSLKFLVEGSEVRPKNMAIKIWKRVN